MGFLFLWSFDGGGFVSEARDWEEEVGEKKLMQLRLKLLWGSFQPTLYIYFCQIIFTGTLSKSDSGYSPVVGLGSGHGQAWDLKRQWNWSFHLQEKTVP